MASEDVYFSRLYRLWLHHNTDQDRYLMYVSDYSERLFLYKNSLEKHNQDTESNHSVTEQTSGKPLSVRPHTSECGKPRLLIQGNQHVTLSDCMFTCTHMQTHTSLSLEQRASFGGECGTESSERTHQVL